MDTALLAAISMVRDLLGMNDERKSLTARPVDCDPNADRRPRIVGYRQDEDGHWVAVLSCGHTQHLRHQPPWQSRPWVLDPERRAALLETPFPCGWCAQGLPPETTEEP
ncbi:DUF3565 domain-containing protein [Metapseudomonas furukawaii]|jgi:hypothetical protein|uniref:DUF3565 domain-containing protein n=1 Tax=Metapseudomonas furukawaii TaxID=1149133 RepID=UPI0009DA7561|nr:MULTISPECIES: DUF3565 domain-containing protein [Pseudomonas]OWJ96007.1 pressure-regulated protein [Pseudomonas sp. A46]WAG78191.1 DUF3565 domain-containing protein [Pseudomonas furukawaii]